MTGCNVSFQNNLNMFEDSYRDRLDDKQLIFDDTITGLREVKRILSKFPCECERILDGIPKKEKVDILIHATSLINLSRDYYASSILKAIINIDANERTNTLENCLAVSVENCVYDHLEITTLLEAISTIPREIRTDVTTNLKTVIKSMPFGEGDEKKKSEVIVLLKFFHRGCTKNVESLFEGTKPLMASLSEGRVDVLTAFEAIPEGKKRTNVIEKTKTLIEGLTDGKDVANIIKTFSRKLEKQESSISDKSKAIDSRPARLIGLGHKYSYSFDQAGIIKAIASVSTGEWEEAVERGIAMIEDLIDKYEQRQSITLFDAKPLCDYLAFSALYPEKTVSKQKRRYEAFFKELKLYFTETNQIGSFKDLEFEVQHSALLSFINDNPNRFAHYQPTEAFWALQRQVLREIYAKKNQQPAISGVPREIYTEGDLKIIDALGELDDNGGVRVYGYNLQKKVKKWAKNAVKIMDRYSTPFEAEKLTSKAPKELIDDEIESVLDAKEALLKLRLDLGSFCDIDLMTSHPSLPKEFCKRLKEMMTLSDVRGPNIDIALFKRIQKQHDDAAVHPKVAVEGGGPTGLLTALTQYQAGADVLLLEKRSMFYERTQIVRLDPKWMAMLQFYLGEEYYKLFKDKGHRGIIRDVGSGEIATVFLEQALHMILTKMISIDSASGKEKDSPAIEQLAAHEMRDVVFDDRQQKFIIKAYFNFQQDPMTIITGRAAKEQHVVEKTVDIVLCAGGKNSYMKEKFFPSSVAVTNKKNYGVCSWLSAPVAGREQTDPQSFAWQNPEEFNSFNDFRGVIKMEAIFYKRFQNKIEAFADLMKVSNNDVINKVVEKSLDNFKHNFIRYSTGRQFLQTRTFENLGLIYIGMEIPEEIKKYFFDALEKDLNTAIERTEEEEKNKLEEQKKAIIKAFQECWFQTVADNYSDSLELELKPENIDKRFLAFFSLDQHRLKESFITIRKKGASLFAAALGDANTTPHFMRYSGLTGAREDLLCMQERTDAIAHRYSEEKRQKLDEEIKKRWKKTVDFVIDKGKVFLHERHSDIIDNARSYKLECALDEECKKTGKNYQMRRKGDKFELKLTDGKTYSLYVTDSGYRLGKDCYQSFEQIKQKVDAK